MLHQRGSSIPTPSDLHHTTPFPSAPVQRWSPRRQRLFLAGLASGLFLYLLALVLLAVFVAPVATLAATVTLVPATRTLSTTLTAATQERLHAAVRSNERLAGPVQCQPTVTPDHPVGSNASQVTVSVSVTCHAQAYDDEAVVRLVTDALMQQAITTLGSGYVLRGTLNTIITPAGTPPHAKPGTLTLLVTGQGVWVYQVRRAEQARLSRLIAGLSRQQAIHVLQQQEPGHLAAVHIQVTGLWTDGSLLPTDPAHIQLVVTMGG